MWVLGVTVSISFSNIVLDVGTMTAAMVEKCMWRLILLVFCMLFYLDTIAAITESRILGSINDNIF